MYVYVYTGVTLHIHSARTYKHSTLAQRIHITQFTYPVLTYKHGTHTHKRTSVYTQLYMYITRTHAHAPVHFLACTRTHTHSFL